MSVLYLISIYLCNLLFHFYLMDYLIRKTRYSDTASKSPDGHVCRLATTGLGALYKNKRIWDMTAKSYMRS